MSMKTSHVVVALVLAGGLGGLIAGTRGTRITTEARRQTILERAQATPVSTTMTGDARPAVTWAELGTMRRGPNADYVNHLSNLVPAEREPETLEGRDARLAQTLVLRSQRRAYDGAPPRIPHAIDERSTSACLACHQDGVVVAGHVAPRMSHPVHDNCTQCHVALSNPAVEIAASPPVDDNAFVGTQPRAGFRFLPGAPPVMPHTRWMRETCASCHGPLGAPGLRTTHPERQNCEQCHVPAPSLQQEIYFP